MSNDYIKAIKTKLCGERDIELADLKVYLKNQVAIGEHPDIGVEIEKKIKKIDSLESVIDTIDKHFLTDKQSELLLND
tara:strand:+ start:74 stop:307 length:234 start_codon:yes stop_codon:yes gene_type:complete